MDPHLSWYNFLPFYETLLEYLQNNYSFTVVFNSGILPKDGIFETVHHIFAALLVFIILCVSALIVKFKIANIDKAIIPQKTITLVNLYEIIVEVVSSTMKDIIGKKYKEHVPFVGTLALFILCSNLIGLIPGFLPPTDNLNTTLACGIIVFIYFNYFAFKVQGINHIIHLANPIGQWWGWFLSPLLFPIEFIGLCVRPFSLAIRLAGNMIGDHSVIIAFASVLPFLIPLPFFFFGLMVSLIQTFVFCLLTCVYISLHTQEQH